MPNVLVTGGAGYIGSILVPELLSRGHQVTVLDSFLYRQNSLALSFSDPNLKVVVGDIRDESLVRSLVSGADVIFPLAAIVGAPACNRDATAAVTINHDAPLALFGMTSTDQTVIMPTTNSAYGTTAPGSVSTEESPLNPISSYSQHKVAVERALLDRGNGTSLRLATVFGMSPRMRLDLLVNDLTYRAIHDRSVVLFEAHFVRNYLHVRDAAGALIWSMENPQLTRGEVFNVGLSSANLTKRELCEAIQRHLPGFVFTEADAGKDPDQRNYTVSNEKIEQAGFVFEHDLDAGLGELVRGLSTLRNSVYSNL